jgi:hypothetical protein
MSTPTKMRLTMPRIEELAEGATIQPPTPSIIATPWAPLPAPTVKIGVILRDTVQDRITDGIYRYWRTQWHELSRATRRRITKEHAITLHHRARRNRKESK